jgi:hypothetical protein
MTRRIRTTEPTLKTIQDTGASLRRVEAAGVEAALGAEATVARLHDALAPLTLFALREELVQSLQTGGGHPGCSGGTHQVKIPLGDKEWMELEELAAAVSSPGVRPSASQVASVLLTLSVRLVASQIAGSPKPDDSELPHDD